MDWAKALKAEARWLDANPEIDSDEDSETEEDSE